MLGAPAVEAYIYIYHLGLKFNLPTLPESITDNMSIQFEFTPVLARSAPQATFGNAGPRTFNAEIHMHRHLFALENKHIDSNTLAGYQKFLNPATGQMETVKDIDAADLLINALLTLSLPKFTDTTKAIVPPSLLIRYGNESAIRGVPGRITKTSSGPWLKNGKMAEVKISFEVTETQPFSAQYVAQNGTLRSISTQLDRSSVWQQ